MFDMVSGAVSAAGKTGGKTAGEVMRRATTITENVREYIIGLLEDHKIERGERVPPAREIAATRGGSFIKVQHAIDSLCHDGILETVPRQGTFVRKTWDSHRLRNSISISGSDTKSFIGLDKVIHEEVPELRINKEKLTGDFEISVTLNIQSNHKEYLDLSEILDELYPDKSIFYTSPFDSFRKGKSLYAIPMLFSPRVIVFNIDMLERAGCPLPEADWAWEDFLTAIRHLKSKYLPENIYCHYPYIALNMLMPFIFRGGGGFLDKQGNVIINSPESRRGLMLYKDLLRTLGYTSYGSRQMFTDGNLVFSFAPRQEVMPSADTLKFRWGSVPLPTTGAGNRLTGQTTEGLCVHKSCSNLKLVKKVVKAFLSERFQNCLAAGKYGIPIRKDIAEKSIAGSTDERDKLFFREIPNMCAEYAIETPEIMDWLRKGLNSLLMKNEGDFDNYLDELAIFFKKYIELDKYGEGSLYMN